MGELVRIQEGEARTTSLVVADTFGKQHFHVLRSIDALISDDEALASNFGCKQQTVPTGKGGRRQVRYVTMDRDGFMLLVMGFTGVKALAVKKAFLREFNRMEAVLRDGVHMPDLRRGVSKLLQHPNFCTAEERDATLIAMNVLRRVEHISGSRAAYQMWLEYGFPDVEGKTAGLPAPEDRPMAPLIQWAADRQVRANPFRATDAMELWTDYANWANRCGLRASEPDRFRCGLRNLFGKEARRGLFAIEIGASDPGAA